MDNITLEKLAAGLRHMLGDEAADLIIQEVMMRLDEMYGSRKRDAAT